jgi:hypothetical protein
MEVFFLSESSKKGGKKQLKALKQIFSVRAEPRDKKTKGGREKKSNAILRD